MQEQVFWPGLQATVNVMTQQTLRTAGVYLPRVRSLGGFLAVREAVPERLGVTVAPPSVFRRELAAGWVRRRDVADLQVTPGYVRVSRPRPGAAGVRYTVLDLTSETARRALQSSPQLYPAELSTRPEESA